MTTQFATKTVNAMRGAVELALNSSFILLTAV